MLGRYLLGEQLAIGGMGEVRLALQLGLGSFKKPVAIKLLLPHLAADSRSVERFLNEAHLASQMSHPNIVQIFDVGVEGGKYFIAMELIRGVAMSQLIRALRANSLPLPPHVLEYVGRSLCDALHHAHSQTASDGQPLDLVHRDVTPHNVMLSVAGEVKLTDFGIAKAREQTEQTHPGVLRGKLEFLAPEQIAGKGADRRTDIYGAGLTLFRLATLTTPFRKENGSETLRAIRDEPLASLATFRSDLAATFSSAVARATQKDPTRRFSSAAEFRDAIAPSTSSESTEALGQLVRKLCRKELDRLEEKTHQTVLLNVETVADTVPERRRPWFVSRSLAGLVVLGLIATGLALSAWKAWSLAGNGGLREVPEDRAAGASPPAPAAEEPLSPLELTPLTESNAALPQPPSPVQRTRPPPSPYVPPRPQSAVGFVNVDAIPWALVYIAGREVGYTPIGRYPAEPGRVEIRLENPQNRKVATRTVRVLPGKNHYVKVDLR